MNGVEKSLVQRNKLNKLRNNGLDMAILKDINEITIYTDSNFTWEKFFENNIDEIKAQFPNLLFGTAEEIIKISEYNKEFYKQGFIDGINLIINCLKT